MIPDTFYSRLKPLLDQLKQSFDGDTPYHFSEWDKLSDKDLEPHLERLMERLAGHYPFHQPFYAGQMIKPPHPAAWLAYALSMTINPNNHALDGGPEASRMEKEVLEQLKSFTGLPNDALGHLTSSGTIANLEALWVARELHPERPVAVSKQAHYTHRRMCQILRHPVMEIPSGDDGYPDPEKLEQNEVLPGTLVVTLGTTGLGRVEPLHHIMEWANRNQVRVHVDAAYGGFFHLLRNSGILDPEPWRALEDADSIVIDPHKHGLQPYGCGSVLFRDPSVGRFYKHDSPYTYFSSEELHLGEISLECSRAGSAAVALWFTLQLLPLTKSNEKNEGLAGMLLDCLLAARRFYELLFHSRTFQPVLSPELDIVAFFPLTDDATYSGVTQHSKAILKAGMEVDATNCLYLSTLELTREEAERWMPDLVPDQDKLTVLRTVLMKPEHYDFVPEMMRRLDYLHNWTR